MTLSREIARDLMMRLMSGERGEIPLHLSLLLERSLLIDSDETQYRDILPPDLADIKLSRETCDEIIAVLCTAVLQNPDAALIAAMSFAGTNLVTETMSSLLVNPPRPLTMSEKTHALSIIAKYLPCNLAAHSQLLSRNDLIRLISVLKALEDAREVPEDPWHAEIRHHAGNLLASLENLAGGPGLTDAK